MLIKGFSIHHPQILGSSTRRCNGIEGLPAHPWTPSPPPLSCWVEFSHVHKRPQHLLPDCYRLASSIWQWLFTPPLLIIVTICIHITILFTQYQIIMFDCHCCNAAYVVACVCQPLPLSMSLSSSSSPLFVIVISLSSSIIQPFSNSL